MTIPGLHHVTALAGEPQRNLDFYTGVLGLRLVKLTVNFDDPGTYHLYYGDHAGTPGTILTFFPWPGAGRGRQGAGQVTEIAFAAPRGSVDYWVERLDAAVSSPVKPDSQGALRFEDPDGLPLCILPFGEGGGHAILRIAQVALGEREAERTAALLTGTMGVPADAVRLDLNQARIGSMGVGTVHHVAFRAEDDDRQRAWQRLLMSKGLHVTEVLDREYFRSIYFREPGGVLFEIATDPPGFTADESLEELGTHLKLPPWLEPRRTEIERGLAPLRLPQ